MKEELKDYALKYNKEFNFNVIPFVIRKSNDKVNKSPKIDWKLWQDHKMTSHDVSDISWNHGSNALAIIHQETSALDFDKCTDLDFIKNIAAMLGLKWIVKTGGGFHIHFRLKDHQELYKTLEEKKFYSLKPQESFKSIVDHLEIRLRGVMTILPPSNYPNTEGYYFINGFPKDPPEEITTELLVSILEEYFIFSKPENNSNDHPTDSGELIDIYKYGVNEGERHISLIKLFGWFYSQGISEEVIQANLSHWNKLNRPPECGDIISKQVDDLWKRYAKGFDGKFYRFYSCLLALPFQDKEKLKRIIAFSVIEFDSDGEILKELNISDLAEQYHSECKDFINERLLRSPKQMIISIGKKILLNTLSDDIPFKFFYIFAGICSYLGRQKSKVKRISSNIISYRSIGFKNEMDYMESDSTIEPPSRYKVKQAINFLKKYKYIQVYKDKLNKMPYYSTYFPNDDALMRFIEKGKHSKLIKELNENEQRLTYREKIQKDNIELEEKIKRQKRFL